MDTGVKFDHPDLQENFSYQYSRNFYGLEGLFPENKSDYHDRDGHGTHVAGIIGAVGNNDGDDMEEKALLELIGILKL